MPEQIVIRFGALCSSIRKQINSQGFYSSDENFERWEKNSADITRLHIWGLLTDSEVRRARKRLLKMISYEVKRYPKPTSTVEESQ